jgi:hypothetical protein
MEVSMVKKCIVMMLMIMLAVTQIECITQSQEIEPDKLKLAPTLCKAKCGIICVKQITHYVACMKPCVRACYGVLPSVKTKH